MVDEDIILSHEAFNLFLLYSKIHYCYYVFSIVEKFIPFASCSSSCLLIGHENTDNSSLQRLDYSSLCPAALLFDISLSTIFTVSYLFLFDVVFFIDIHHLHFLGLGLSLDTAAAL